MNPSIFDDPQHEHALTDEQRERLRDWMAISLGADGVGIKDAGWYEHTFSPDKSYINVESTDEVYTPVEYGNVVPLHETVVAESIEAFNLLMDHYLNHKKYVKGCTRCIKVTMVQRLRVWWRNHRPHLHFGQCPTDDDY